MDKIELKIAREEDHEDGSTTAYFNNGTPCIISREPHCSIHPKEERSVAQIIHVGWETEPLQELHCLSCFEDKTIYVRPQ